MAAEFVERHSGVSIQPQRWPAVIPVLTAYISPGCLI
jgi:hypothetical protein